MEDNHKIIKDISLLYELSLAVGQSLDFEENCSHFLNVLMARKSISYAAVWLADDHRNYSLAYASPINKVDSQKITSNHYIVQQLEKENFFIHRDGDAHFEQCIQEVGISNGCYILYRLGRLGFLKLYAAGGSQFSRIDAIQIRSVVNKFRLLLSGCLAHERLKKEISERTKIQEELNTSEEKLRKIIDTSLDGIITIDEEGMVTEWSKQAVKIFGYTQAEAIGQEMADLIVPHRYQEAHRNGMKHFLKTGEGPVLNSRIEITSIDKTKREFPIELSISPIRLDGKYIFSAFIRDITDRKQAEADLIKAKQVAEQARLAEQQFLANMSHEIRTPMNAVIGMTHLMYETQPTESQREYLDSLRFSADSLMGIINNILDLSKIEAGELDFEKRTFDLRSLLLSLQQTFQFKLRDKPVSVVVDLDSRIENQLIGDSVRLIQILTNLLGNASKFTKRGTIGVKVQILAQSLDRYILEFKVHDTGIGIEADNIDRIFQNFKQAEVGITRKFGGTGLGLAIVKQLVELQGGSIQVTSEKHKGSVFTVVLPFQNAHIKQLETSIEDKMQEEKSIAFDHLHLLVVEDNPMNQKLIGKILEMWHCPFDIAASGEEAIQYSQKQKYDLILMDIHMPEMDGCETTQHIRSDRQNINMESPIVALTAAALLDEKNRAIEAGMDDFLTKPFAPKQLSEKIQHWTSQVEDTGAAGQQKFTSTKQAMVKVDLQYLHNLSKGDDQFVQDMITIFLREIPNAMTAMKKAHEAHDWRELEAIAHRIKTNYMMVGMKEQEEIALKLEKNIRQNLIDPLVLDPMVYQLRNDSKLALPILEANLNFTGN
ncbi:MAG: response regulator [Bacteroidota bacterium]